MGAIVLGGILGPLFLLLGLRVASAGSVALWLNLELVATVVLGHFVFHEHFSLRGWTAAGGTLFAAMLLAGAEGNLGLLSVCLVAVACLCWGFDNHFTARIDGITPAQTTLWKGLTAGSFNLIVGGTLAGGVGGLNGLIGALLVGAVSYGISVMLYINTAQGMGAGRSQMIFSSAPFFGLALSVVVLGESFTESQALAAGIMIASLLFLFRERHLHFHRHDPIQHIHEHQHKDGHHDHRHEGLPRKMSHSHWHVNGPKEHEHAHWPDLHHKHGHADNRGSKR
jgi:drug/metabolite transporter (DMT)-like permease